MNIHEFQAKQVLGRFGVPVPKGIPASTLDEAVSAFDVLGQPKVVIKAQIHAGGRGKAGGVKLSSSDPGIGRSACQAGKIGVALGVRDKQVGQFGTLIASLYRAFIETDASLIEINPLVVTKDGSVICLDAKMAFDDNALFRHPDIRELRDPNEEDPAEVEASKFDLTSVHLPRNIAFMVTAPGPPLPPMHTLTYPIP